MFGAGVYTAVVYAVTELNGELFGSQGQAARASAACRVQSVPAEGFRHPANADFVG